MYEYEDFENDGYCPVNLCVTRAINHRRHLTVLDPPSFVILQKSLIARTPRLPAHTAAA